uniref:Uncharacterized protein LOC111100019 n=1 Tax=Crassostrea virginica TaxID=6565 RepID=A0A8B8A751_CRAVI|nr:uncharacterized protein LOC111100019 [Crassostrea virginica]XP_022287293.1 uncharacterized protein LOC111100019 [Crassostrea virginica]
MEGYIYTILLIQLCNQMRFVVSFTRRCNESLQTVQKVLECPTNLTAYEAAAKQKNCSSFNADSCHSFQYHCVLSEDFHSLVEVCAPSLNIIGHVCAKFTWTLKSIIRVEGMNCTDGPEECPYSYNSTHAYKYQQCYNNILYSSSSTTVSNQRELNTSTVLLSSLLPILFVIAIVCIIWCWRRRKRNKEKDNNYLDIELQDPLMQQQQQNIDPDNNNLDSELTADPLPQDPVVPQQQHQQQHHQQQQQQITNPENNDLDREIHADQLLPDPQIQQQKQHQQINDSDLDETPSEGQRGHLEISETLMNICEWKGSKYLPYRKYETRQKSFNSCETDCMRIKAGDLAKLGFYYRGYGKTMSCFYCGIIMEEVDETVNLARKHKISCEYGKRVIGPLISQT